MFPGMCCVPATPYTGGEEEEEQEEEEEEEEGLLMRIILVFNSHGVAIW